MREYNNRDIKTNDAELDPCIAAEVRMKKSVVSPRARKGLVVLLAVAVLAAVLCVVLFILLSPSSSKKEPHADRVADYEHFESAVELTTASTKLPPYITFTQVPSISSILSKFDEEADNSKNDESGILEEADEDENAFSSDEKGASIVAEPIFVKPPMSPTTTSSSSQVPSTGRWPITAQTSPTAAAPRTRVPSAAGKPPTAAAATIAPSAATAGSNSSRGGDSKILLASAQPLPPAPRFDASGDTGDDCKSLLEKGKRGTGVYELSLLGAGKFDAFCDMNTDGGGWTLIQRRVNGAVHFWNRTWDEYETGFGDIGASFWLGLKKIHALVAKGRGRPLTLRVELRGDLCNDTSKCSNLWNGFWWGEWDFKLSDASQNYTLTMSPARAGNLTEHTNMDKFFYMNNDKPFTTVDRDNDRLKSANCAQFRELGGWWHNDCGYVSLNGRYGDTSWKMRSMYWFYTSGTRQAKSYYIKPRRSEMKLRPKA